MSSSTPMPGHTKGSVSFFCTATAARAASSSSGWIQRLTRPVSPKTAMPQKPCPSRSVFTSKRTANSNE